MRPITFCYGPNKSYYEIGDVFLDKNGKVKFVEARPILPWRKMKPDELFGIDWKQFENDCYITNCKCKSRRNYVHDPRCKCPECKNAATILKSSW